MIYFSKDTDVEIPVGTGVQETDGVLQKHSDGNCIGFIRENFSLESGGFRTQIYVAGGGGSPMILCSDWDGNLTRFEIINGHVAPVNSGGVGWLIPEYPQTSKNTGDLVLGALYK